MPLSLTFPTHFLNASRNQRQTIFLNSNSLALGIQVGGFDGFLRNETFYLVIC